MDTRYFDIENFEQNKGKQGYHNEYRYNLPDNSKVREYKIFDNLKIFYIRIITKDFSPFNYYYLYYDNGILFTGIKNFNKSPIHHVEYDKIGNRKIKEIDYDKFFKNSFEQIREIILREKKVDIYDKKQAIANRFEKSDTYTAYYQIHIMKSEKIEGQWYSHPIESFLINDDTGKILTEEDIKRMKNPSTPSYRTHNGKSYTEAEWKTYEEAQYQEYLKKKNGKGFWDKLFGD